VEHRQEMWDIVNDRPGKVVDLVSDIGMTCENNNLEENDLLRNLHAIYQSLETCAMHS